MKEFVVIHDYLVSEEVVGDWEGQEEIVAERVNEIYHTLYNSLPDLDMDDIYDWCRHVLENRDQFIQETFN